MTDPRTTLVGKPRLPDAELAKLRKRVVKYVEASLSPATKRAYKSDWDQWEAFCSAVHSSPRPATPESLALYLASLAEDGKSVSTIERALAAITKGHEVSGLASPRAHPLVKQSLRGIRREIGVRQSRVDAISPEQLKLMVTSLPHTKPGYELRSMRDHVLLVVGFAGGFRRSEIVNLNFEDLRQEDDGFVVLLRRSKTDQEGKGRLIGLPYGSHLPTCPSRQLERWIRVRGAEAGPLFCGVSRDGMALLMDHRLVPRTVARIVQRGARHAGLDGWFAGHSLRAGLVTSAARANKPIHSITAQTGHKSIEMVMRYIREVGLWEENAAANIGL